MNSTYILIDSTIYAGHSRVSSRLVIQQRSTPYKEATSIWALQTSVYNVPIPSQDNNNNLNQQK